ncbi:MAG: VPLPA-CTERM sorting domain-containing protein, partial [Gammaproteobacteria bacterium]|nr:VPLPA-CTERM sorting domain-containing protein [Gammaproteobacteria bacterium]
NWLITYDYNEDKINLSGSATSAVPVPAAAWLFASGLLGLVGVARRRS